MSKHHRSQFTVEWGDCDPAQIVFYPNFFRWMDAASLRFFRAAGVPPWRELEAQSGIIGTPLVDASARFLRPATYGDVIDIDTAIDDDHRFFLAQLSLEAMGEGLVRSLHADDPVFEQFARLAAKGYPVAKKLAKNDEVSD